MLQCAPLLQTYLSFLCLTKHSKFCEQMKGFNMLLVKSLWTVIFHFIKGKLSNICIGCSSTTFNADIDFFYFLNYSLIITSVLQSVWLFPSISELISMPRKHWRPMNPTWTAWPTSGVWGFEIRVFLLLQYCQEITYPRVCPRPASKTPASCVCSARVLPPRRPRLARCE